MRASMVLAGLAALPLMAQEQDKVKTLEQFRWSLESATDAKGKAIEGLAARKGRVIVFAFSKERLNIKGPCNQMMGSYEVSAAGEFTGGAMASTMMACDPEAMKAEAALHESLGKTWKIEIDNGPTERMWLVSESEGRLAFTGHATAESRLGPGTIIFLEVAPQRVACENPPPGEKQCLQVRERRYDGRGLAVGTPGDWAPLHESIEGYKHENGVRNVLRLKKYAAAPPVYVLDLVVESEAKKP